MKKIGIDIGATNTRIGLVDIEKNEILFLEKFETFNNHYSKEIERIKHVVETIQHEWSIEAIEIGICMPGPIDASKGQIINPPNLANWHNKNIKLDLQKAIANATVRIENDANVAALGQYHRSGGNIQSLLYITVSSGFGAGFIIDGKIYSGFNGKATEIARSIVCFDDKRADLENMCSGNGIAREVSKIIGVSMSSKQVFKAYATNDIIKNYIDNLIQTTSDYLTNIIYLLNPEKILFGGSVAENNHFIFDKIIAMAYEKSKFVDHQTTMDYAKDILEFTLIAASKIK